VPLAGDLHRKDRVDESGLSLDTRTQLGHRNGAIETRDDDQSSMRSPPSRLAADQTLQMAGGQGRVPARTTLMRSRTILEYVIDSNRHTWKKE
jgi:hypothetical protein